ncbi:hypothetical protein AU255_02025 [Methyloprofundus sedimenti]|uniref:IgGFc-binding protein N-terminal domain-containing protein n=1 Tax=Methyloprofundus sedimenti TaxID=1420851 RepID=A0A1V8M5C5_9GAMM|nr:hypothetical protein [Methyloprofundus sedimenti]OQK16708.1 hypothetical protein AU255_02025 [Methyloprofundus sedimenti]
MFKKTKIAAASAVILGLSSMAAQADGDLGVALNAAPSGGQVLVFPYYNVNNEFITVYNITNTTDAYKAIKVRFRESDNSNDVIDFNVYMSPHDVYTMQLEYAPAAGPGEDSGGVKLTTTDKTCAYPAIPADGLLFRYGVYASTVVEDVREGYLEVIEMGEIDEEAYVRRGLEGDGQLIASEGLLHDGDGVPADCSVIDRAWKQAVFVQGGAESNGSMPGDVDWVNPLAVNYPMQPTESDRGYYGLESLESQAMDTGLPNEYIAYHGTPITEPKGGIVGTSILVDLATIIGFVAEPTSILNYSEDAQHYLSQDDHFFHLPSLASGSNEYAYRAQGQLVEYDNVVRDWGLDDRDILPKTHIPSGINPMPVADVMLVTTLGNQYFLGQPGDAINTVSDLVVAAPMRKHAIYNDYQYHAEGTWDPLVDLPDNYIAVGSTPFTTPGQNGQLADEYGYWEYLPTAYDVNADVVYYDREEASYSVKTRDFSPPFAIVDEIIFDKEVNILSLHRDGTDPLDSVLGSENKVDLTMQPGFNNGWISFSFAETLTRSYNLTGDRYEEWFSEGICLKGCRFDAFGVPLHGFMASRVPARGGYVGEAFPHFYTRVGENMSHIEDDLNVLQ